METLNKGTSKINRIEAENANLNSETAYLGQEMFFEQVENAEEERPLMARIALTIGGHEEAYPVLVSDIVYSLSFYNRQAVLGIIGLRSNVALTWCDPYLQVLRTWADEQDSNAGE